MAGVTRKQPATAKPEALASPPEVAEVLGVPVHTLDQWRSQGKGPKYIKVGRHVRYDWADVRAWLDSHRVSAPAV